MKRTALCLIVMAFIFSNAYAIGKKYESGKFEVLPTSVNTNAYEFGISYYRNNTVVFFRTDSTVSEISDKDLSKSGIAVYQAQIKNGDLVDAEICQELMDLGVGGSFAYDKDQDKIYFSKYNKTNNVYQLFESYYKEDKWEEAQPVQIKGLTPSRYTISTVVNANWDYLQKGASIIQPTLAKDGNRLYFSSNLKKGGEGKMDIWYVDYDSENEAWGTPVNVGKDVNTSASEQYPFIMGDSVLYYASNANGKFDLHAARLDEEGIVTEAENIGDFFNTGEHEYNLIADANTLFFVAERGNAKDEIMHIVPIIPPSIPYQIVFKEPEPLKNEPEFHHILFFFDFDRSNLKPEFLSQLDQIVDEMKQFPEQRFVVAGYTDDRGSDAYNDKLSMRRAKTVYDLLVQRGADKDALVLKAYGKRMLAIPNAQTEEEHAQNRRVEIDFYTEE